jgi:protein CWC15
VKAKYDDADEGGGEDDSEGWSDVDEKEGDEESDLDASESDDESDSDDEDDEEALQAELAKIRAEREAAKQKEEAEKTAAEESQMEEAALIGNPLLSADGVSGRMKRKWNDDVVFRNQAKGEPEVKKRL